MLQQQINEMIKQFENGIICTRVSMCINKYNNYRRSISYIYNERIK